MASRCKCVQYVHHGFTLSLPQSSIVAVLQAMVVVVSTVMKIRALFLCIVCKN